MGGKRDWHGKIIFGFGGENGARGANISAKVRKWFDLFTIV